MVYDALFSDLIAKYDAMPEQFDDPIGRVYCLAFQSSPGAAYRPFDSSFMSRFSTHPNIRPAGYCRTHDARWMVVNRVEWNAESSASVWSLSKVTSRSGYATCRNLLQLERTTWRVVNCVDGAVFN
jgi:hypothetical protein